MCEFPATYMMRVRRARKEHRCRECGGKILKGESYNYHSGVWDGQGRSFKVCPECNLLRDELDKDRDIEDRIVFGGLVEDVQLTDDLAAARVLLSIMEKRGAWVPTWLLDCQEIPVL